MLNASFSILHSAFACWMLKEYLFFAMAGQLEIVQDNEK